MNLQIKNSLLDAVSRSPTGDNMQPFFLEFNGEKLIIHFDSQSARHEFDFKQLASCIALGCLLYSIEVASQELGLTPSFAIHDLKPINSTWCEVSFSQNKPSKHIHFAYLNERRTTRTPYVRDPSPSELIGWLSKQNDINFTTDTTDEFIKACQHVDLLFWSNKTAVHDFFRMIHFLQADYAQSRTGMHWKELGIKLHEIPLSFIFKKQPWLLKIIYPLFFKYIINDIWRRNLKSSSVFVCIPKDCSTAKTLRDLQLQQIEVGKIGMRIWLQATKLGLLAQPISPPALLANLFYVDDQTSFLTNTSHKEVLKESVDEVCRFFKLNENQIPGWIFRIGNKPPVCTEPPRSLRRTDKKSA